MPVNLCGLQAAESNRAVLRYLKEDDNCWGVTPASGSSRELRITSSSLTAEKQTVVSNELRADRMVADVIETAASSGGDIEAEFSAGSLDEFMQAFVLGLWTRPMGFDKFEGANVSMNDNAGTTEVLIAGGDYRAYFTVGRRIKTEGFIKPANNDFWQIASLSFSGGTTTIVTTGTTGIDESGSDYSKVFDANDVVVLKNTTIRAGTSSTKTFDSNGGNAFASAIAAGQLVVGQKIYVQGLGYETGTFAFGGLPSDGETVTINDGEKAVTFEFDNNSAFTRGNVGVTIGGSAAATAANLQAAIMDQLWKKRILCSASVSTSTVTVTNLHPDQIANAATTALTEATASAVTATSFSGATASNGVFTITALTDDVITVAESVGTNANSGTKAVTIKGSHLRNPGSLDDITPQSFTVETGFSDVNQYFKQTGLRVGAFGLSVSSGELVSANMTLMGKETTTATTSVLGNSPYNVLSSTATPVLNATTNVGDIYKNGELLATALQSIEINGEAALREQRAVGSRFAAGIGTGRFNLTGKITSYFETLEMYAHFLNHDTISLAFDFKDNDYSVYWFTIPALKITSDPIAPGGIDQDVLEELEFVALRDPGLQTMFMVDRFSSTLPATA
ncbi:MAG: phage tail tube protein [Betaproteobacteria bacterium]